MPETSSVENTEELEKTSEGQVQRWCSELLLAEKEFKTWHKTGTYITRRYRAEEDFDYDFDVKNRRPNRLNLFWSNVQTILPLLYSRPPQPYVERRFKDRDPVARVASQILERALTYCIDIYPFNSIIRQAVLDYLLVGRGAAWVRYVPQYSPVGSSIKEGRGESQPDRKSTRLNSSHRL